MPVTLYIEDYPSAGEITSAELADPDLEVPGQAQPLTIPNFLHLYLLRTRQVLTISDSTET